MKKALFRSQTVKSSILSGLFLFSLFVPLCLQAAEIVVNDGQKFDGKILEEQPDYVLMEIENGVQVRIERSEIAFIQREDIKTQESLKVYPAIGITYGTPSVLNLVAGYYIDDWGLKLSGAYWGGVRGVQANLSYKLLDTQKFLVDLSLVGGALQTNGPTNGYSVWSSGAWSGTQLTYGGMGFDFSYIGFFFELDAVSGNFPNP